MVKSKLIEHNELTFEELQALTKKKNMLRLQGKTEEEIEIILLEEEQK